MTTKLKSGNFSADQLNQLVARIERLEEEKKALADDIKEVYAEAKAHGFDTAIMRQVIKLRKMDPADMTEQEQLLATYMHALGMNLAGPLADRAAQIVASAEVLPLPPTQPAEIAAMSPRVAEMARIADERGVSPEVKDLAVRTAMLAETKPRSAAAVIATVHALATEGAEEDEPDDHGGGSECASPEPATMHAGSSNPDYDALGNIPEFLRRT